MGHKVNPKVFRLGILYQSSSRWFDMKNYRAYIKQDVTIRSFLKKKLREARVSKIDIERSGSSVKVFIHTSRPGVIIGRGGSALEDLKKSIQQFVDAKATIELNIQEVRKPDLESQLIVQSIVEQLEKRIPFRKAMKRAMGQVMQAGALGVKISIGGRLNGAEIARTEVLAEGKIPLHTIRADIDYAYDRAHTTYGAIGVKAWIYRGDIFESKQKGVTPAPERKQVAPFRRKAQS